MIIGTSTDPWVSGFSSVGLFSSKPSSESVAQSFESLVLRQILTSLRSSSLSDPGGPESGWLAMGDDALASYLSKGARFRRDREIITDDARRDRSIEHIG